MTKIKYDVRDSDPEIAEQITGTFESPKPGVYAGKLLELNEKGSGGDPDKPMLEAVFELTRAEKKENERFVRQRSRLWYYLLLPGHPSFEGFVVQKLDQFLLAAGVNSKKKRTGVFDTDDLIDTEFGIVIRAGKDRDDNYRGEVGSVFAYDPETFGQSGDDDEEDDFIDLEVEATDDDEDEEVEEEEAEEEGDEDEDEDGAGDEDEGEDEEGEEEVPPYDEWTTAELREELEARELNPKGNKAQLVERLEADDAAGGEDEEESGSDDDEEFPF